MNFATKVLSAAILAGALAAGAAQADDVNGVHSMKPLEGVLFNVGAKHAVGYFYNEGGACKLVLTLADAPGEDAIQTFTAIRHEATVPAGDATRFKLAEGKAFEFSCNGEAVAMQMKEVAQVVAGATR